MPKPPTPPHPSLDDGIPPEAHESLFRQVAAWFSERDTLTDADRDSELDWYRNRGSTLEEAQDALHFDRHAVSLPRNAAAGTEGETIDVSDGDDDDPGSLDDWTAYSRARAANEAGAMLDDAGWYTRSADPYPKPVLPFDRDVHGPGYVPNGPLVDTVRRIWLARYNPEDHRWTDENGTSTSDVAAPGAFGWDDPSAAIRAGNYWLNTSDTPLNREGIEQLELGDLVVVQRTAPTTKAGKSSNYDRECGNHDVLYGLAAVWQTESWNDAETLRRETRVALLPLTKFTYPVSRSQLRSSGRLRSDRFKKMAQLLDGTGPPGFTLFPVTDDRDINELLASIGLPPDVLTEPDLSVVAARVRVTVTGDKDLHRLRWDHRYRHSVRSAHERAAVAAAQAWATAAGWVEAKTVERIPLAGCDWVYTDPAIPAQRMNTNRGHAAASDALRLCWTNQVEIEVKGYTARALNQVHLQPSQQQRARDSVAKKSPPWWLFAVTGIRTPDETAHTLDALTTVKRLDAGQLSVHH